LIDEALLSSTIDQLEGLTPNPEAGLPESLFLFISRMTPLVNVDLLIQNPQGETLLTWRDDRHFGPGWHIPGGIIRLHETALQRITAVAQVELGAKVKAEPHPCRVIETISRDKKNRSHGISLLYRCQLLTPLRGLGPFDPKNPQPGQWQWHSSPPENLILEQFEIRDLMASAEFENKASKKIRARIPSKQFLRYLIVGAWNTAFGYGLFAFLTYLLRDIVPASYLVASFISNLIALTVSFLGYKRWVFKTQGHYLREWLKALGVYSSAILLNLALLPPTIFALIHFTGDPISAPYLAGAILLGLSVTISFFGHKNFTFKQPRPDGKR
jgi:colanic acid biosynthesis protein WcaH